MRSAWGRNNAAMPASRSALALTTLLLLSSSGCIGTQSNDAREFGRFPPESIAGEERFALDIQVAANAAGLAADNQLRANLSEDVRSAYVFHLNQTKRFRSANDTPPYTANVEVFDQGGDSSSLAGAFFTGLTLYLIPSWTTHHYTTTVTLSDPSGARVGRKRYEHQLRLVQQLFLVFGMPFAGLQRSYDEMWNEVMRDAAVWTVETIEQGRR